MSPVGFVDGFLVSMSNTSITLSSHCESLCMIKKCSPPSTLQSQRLFHTKNNLDVSGRCIVFPRNPKVTIQYGPNDS